MVENAFQAEATDIQSVTAFGVPPPAPGPVPHLGDTSFAYSDVKLANPARSPAPSFRFPSTVCAAQQSSPCRSGRENPPTTWKHIQPLAPPWVPADQQSEQDPRNEAGGVKTRQTEQNRIH